MADWELTSEDYQTMWNEWYEDYGIKEFIEFSDENWEKVQKMDPHLVWTNHSTCEDEQVSAGASLFKNSCCWDTFGWYIASEAWEGDPDNHYESINASAYLPCPKCNPDGEDDGVEGCDEPDCDGTGFINYYFD